MGYPVQLSSTSQPLLFLMISSTDHLTGKTGLTPTVTLSKAGAAFASPVGVVTEVGNGWYQVAGNATDDNTLGPLLLHATGTGADPCDDVFGVVAYNPLAATNLGLTSLDALVSSRAATTSLPTNFSLLSVDPGGRVDIQSGALSGQFVTPFSGTTFLASGSLSGQFVTPFSGTTWAASGSLSGQKVQTLTNLDKSGYTLSSSGLDTISLEKSIVAGASLVDDDGTQLTTINVRRGLALGLAVLAGRLSGAGTATINIVPAGQPTSGARVLATVDASGNRTSLGLRVPL